MNLQVRAALWLGLCGWAASALGAPEAPLLRPPDVSFRNEVRHAIGQGLQWLQSHQNSNGWWSTAEQPAVTALALGRRA